MPDTDRLHVTEEDRIVTVTFDHPKTRNSITRDMWVSLRTLFHELAGRSDVRVVVLTGAGDHFGSGADVSDMSRGSKTGKSQIDAMRDVGSAVQALYELQKPTIAKLRGTAVGASANIALACDLTIADTTLRFAEIFARRGLSPDGGGSWLLPRLIGMHRAKELVLLGDVVDADYAREIGLVNRIVEPEVLDTAVDDLARRLAEGPTMATGLSKRLLNQAFSVSLNEALEAEAHAQVVNFTSPDFHEAVRAFMEKRKPEFG